MLSKKQKYAIRLTLGSVVCGAGIAIFGCQSETKPIQADVASTQPDAVLAAATNPKKSGNELWIENCGRCHNIRPPDEFSPQQWDTIVHHMRMRANITGEDARAIAAFLKAG
jgi:cytochrome c5